MKYFKPWSLTWWSALLPFSAGLFLLFLPIHQQYAWAEVIETLTRGAGPLQLMSMGGCFIGIRAAPGVAQRFDQSA